MPIQDSMESQTIREYSIKECLSEKIKQYIKIMYNFMDIFFDISGVTQIIPWPQNNKSMALPIQQSES